MFDYKRRIGSASLFPTNQYERGSNNPMAQRGESTYFNPGVVPLGLSPRQTPGSANLMTPAGGYQFTSDNAPRGFRSPDFGRVGQDNPQYRTPVNPLQPSTAPPQQQSPPLRNVGPPQSQYANENAPRSFRSPDFGRVGQDNPQYRTPVQAQPPAVQNPMAPQQVFGDVRMTDQQIDNEQYAQSGITRGLQPGQLTLEQATQHLQGYAPPRDTPQFTPNERAMQQATRPSPFEGGVPFGGAYSSSQAGMQSQALNPMMPDIRPENRAGAAGLVNGYNGMVGAMNDPNRLTPEDVYNSQGTGTAQIGAQRYGENDPTGMRGRMGAWAPKPGEQYGPVSKDANGRPLDGKISGDPRYATGMLLAAGRDPNRPQRGTPEDKAYLKQKWEQQQAKKQAFKAANGGLSPNQFRKQQTKDRISEFRRGGVAQSKPQNPMASPMTAASPKTTQSVDDATTIATNLTDPNRAGASPFMKSLSGKGYDPATDDGFDLPSQELHAAFSSGTHLTPYDVKELAQLARTSRERNKGKKGFFGGDASDPFSASAPVNTRHDSSGRRQIEFTKGYSDRMNALANMPENSPDEAFAKWNSDMMDFMKANLRD